MADGVRSKPCYGGWKGGGNRAVARKSEGGLATTQFRSRTLQLVGAQRGFIRRNYGGFIRLWTCPPEPWRRSRPAAGQRGALLGSLPYVR